MTERETPREPTINQLRAAVREVFPGAQVLYAHNEATGQEIGDVFWDDPKWVP